LKPALETRSPRSFRRAIATVALACGLIGAPASMMLVNATHAAAEASPPDCFDDPNMPGCPGVGGGGGGEGGGMGSTGGGGKGGGGGGPAYRTFVTSDDVLNVFGFINGESYALVALYDSSQWESVTDFYQAVEIWWDSHADMPRCTTHDWGCSFEFQPSSTDDGRPIMIMSAQLP
jgi:hypothetical protein